MKTCILSLIDRLVKFDISVSKETIQETLVLLQECEGIRILRDFVIRL